jgi:hypothetical protein
MTISDMKKLNSLAKWDAIVQRSPDLQTYREKSAFGKNQGADLYLRGYEKGIIDAQSEKAVSLAASRS